MRTLCLDIGGTGIKALILGPSGEPASERARVPTPKPATPAAVLDAIAELVAPLGPFERVAVGFPGVVVAGMTRSAPNLGPGWPDFDLATRLTERLRRPVRVANDAGVQGLGVIEGSGTEVVLTLGTGMGFGLYVDGIYVPNIEMAHHPYNGELTYEQLVSDGALKEIGATAWEERVQAVVAQLRPILNWRRIYLGGGNARLLDRARFPADVTLVDNAAGLLGGWKLWAGRS